MCSAYGTTETRARANEDLSEWHDMASYFRFRRPYIRWTGYFKYGYFGEDEPGATKSE